MRRRRQHRTATTPWTPPDPDTRPLRSREEVAELIGTTVGNVWAIEKKALRKLRAALENLETE